jgi:hypothetical protein
MVSPPPSISSTTLANATPNASYSATLQASGGAGTLTWSMAGGALPTGLSLSGSGAITGTPTVSGTFTFTVQVLDLSAATGGPSSAQGQISITVTSGSGLSISTTQLPGGTQNTAYGSGLAASGGTTPYTWSVTAGQLPPGLSLQASSGMISGTPTSPGTFTFTVAVRDSSPTPQTQTRSLSITIGAQAPLTITTTSLPNATPNANYSATLQATGGVAPLTWSLTSGALPTGLALAGSGAITGDPTVPGTFTFTVQVSDSSTGPGCPVSVQAQLSITVVTVLSISTTQLPTGSQGIAYAGQVAASGGTLPYAWSVTAGQLPPGLALQSNSGAISGSPSSQGTFTFTVAVRDSSPTPQVQTRPLSIIVGSQNPPTITTVTLPNATPNANYSATLQGAGGVAPLTWSLTSGALPTGLALAGSGAITGDPTVPGTFTFTVQVSDSSIGPGCPVSVQAQLSITVVTVMSIGTTSLPAGSVGVAYLAQIEASGGVPPYSLRLTIGSLPPGLTVQSNSGVISGSPSAPGNFTFTVAVVDSSPTPQAQNQSLTLAIGAPGPLAITTRSLPDGTAYEPYTGRLAAVGGTPPYRWNIATGSLPASVVLDSSVGAFSGTTWSFGTWYFTVMVTDSSATPQTQTQALSITVNNPGEACTSTGNNSALNGQYAFSLRGFNAAGFLAVVGSFTADGTGAITAGEADTNGVLGAQQGNIIPWASSYTVGQDGRGCATLATSFGIFSTRFALGPMSSNPATGGSMIEWDNPSASAYIAAGQLLLQNPGAFSSGLNGSYVFHTIGWDPAPLGGRDACVGVISASGNTFYAMEQDCNDAWNISNVAAPDVAGTYTSVDANGRGTGIIALLTTNSNITFYAVSMSQLLMVNADSGPWASGELDLQSLPAGGGGFTQASLSGSMVFYLDGLSIVGTAAAVSMEKASADGSSSMAITFYEDRAGALQVSSTLTCTYAVEPSGRVTLSSDSQSCGGTTPIFYLSGLNAGFIVDTSPGVDTGSFEPQASGPFNNASLSGNFFGGMPEVVIQTAQTEVDPVTLDGSGSITGTTDINSMSAQDAGAPFPAANYTVNSDGTFGFNSPRGAVTGIIISSTKFLMFSPTTLTTPLPNLLVMQQ